MYQMHHKNEVKCAPNVCEYIFVFKFEIISDATCTFEDAYRFFCLFEFSIERCKM